jgi:hypothetical protein
MEGTKAAKKKMTPTSYLVVLAFVGGTVAIPEVPAPADTSAFRFALEAWTFLSFDAQYG